MRLCRFGSENLPQIGFYDEKRIVPLLEAAMLAGIAGGRVDLPGSASLLDFLR